MMPRRVLLFLALWAFPLSAQTTSWRLSGCVSTMERPTVAGKRYVTKRLASGVLCLADSLVVAPPTPVPAPVVGAWPNEPPGMTLVTDVGFDQPVPVQTDGVWPGTTDWRVSYNAGGLTRVSDLTAPFSAPYVLQAQYNVGFTGGPGVGSGYLTHPMTRELFVGVVWKVGSPYQYSNSGNQKITYALWDDHPPGAFLAFEMCGTSAPAEFCIIPVGWPVDQILHAGTGAGATRTNVALGTWYRLEYFAKYATTATSADGIVRWWVSSWNGMGWNAPVLQGNVTNLQSPANTGGYILSLYTGWSGTLTKTEVDHVWYDHVRVSRR